MDWLTRLMVDTPQQTKQPQATTPAATAPAPAPEPPAASTPVASEPEPPVAEVPAVEETTEPVSEPVNEAATYDRGETVSGNVNYEADVASGIDWKARAEAAEAELAAIPDALRQPPAGYEWVGEIQVDTINNGVWLPFRKVVREVTIRLPSDATDEEVIAAFRAAAG